MLMSILLYANEIMFANKTVYRCRTFSRTALALATLCPYTHLQCSLIASQNFLTTSLLYMTFIYVEEYKTYLYL